MILTFNKIEKTGNGIDLDTKTSKEVKQVQPRKQLHNTKI